ncbi:MAG: LPXTG cell wall anchor domain-containing protein [Cytophagales bacterium]|nr:LPXTG cell wall anchor domain-containing protein [Cytophagales bacterium]
MKKSEAVLYAQAQYLENASYAEKAPFFWAGYYILGNDEPIVNAGTSRYWASLIGLLLVIAGYFTLRRRS